MRRRQLSRSSSSSNVSDSESCFDVDKAGGDSDTNPTDVDTDVEDAAGGGDSVTTLTDVDTDVEDHPPEYYLRQEDDSESDDEIEDYRDSSLRLINGIEQRFYQSASYLHPSSLYTGIANPTNL